MRTVLRILAIAACCAAFVPSVAGAQEGTHRIEGVVTANGEPVADVWVMGYRDGDTWVGSSWGSTDADGHYTLDVEAGVGYRLYFIPPEGSDLIRAWAHADGEGFVGQFGRATATEVVADDAAPLRQVDVDLSPGGTVEGTVTDGSGTPLAGAQVILFGPGEVWVGSHYGTTGADGTYRIHGVAPTYPDGGVKEYQVRFGAPAGSDLPAEWWDDSPTRADGTRISIGVGEVRSGIDARLGDEPDVPAGRLVLGTLGGTESAANAVNDVGVVVGSSTLADDETIRAFRWDPSTGEMAAIGTLGGSHSVANDINDHGVIVGASTLVGDDAREAFVLDPTVGELVSLGTLGGTRSTALAVNNDGVVVGYSTLEGDATLAAFVWDPDSGEMHEIVTTDSEYSIAHDINDDGVVVGEVGFRDDPSRAFVWSDADGFAFLAGERGATASGINNHGVVVGDHAIEHAIGYQPALWQGEETATLDAIGGEYAAAFAINDAGLVVGQRSVVEASEPFVLPDEFEEPLELPDFGDTLFRGVAFDGASGIAFTFESDDVSSVYNDANLHTIVGTVGLPDGSARALIQPISEAGGATPAVAAAGTAPGEAAQDAPEPAIGDDGLSGGTRLSVPAVSLPGPLAVGIGFGVGGLAIAAGIVATASARPASSGSTRRSAVPFRRTGTAVVIAAVVGATLVTGPGSGVAGAQECDCTEAENLVAAHEQSLDDALDRHSRATDDHAAAQQAADTANTALQSMERRKVRNDVFFQEKDRIEALSHAEASTLANNVAEIVIGNRIDDINELHANILIDALDGTRPPPKIENTIRIGQMIGKGFLSTASKIGTGVTWVQAALAAPQMGRALGTATVSYVMSAAANDLPPTPTEAEFDAARNEVADKQAALQEAHTRLDDARRDVEWYKEALDWAYNSLDTCRALCGLPPVNRREMPELPPLPPAPDTRDCSDGGDPHLATCDGLAFDQHAEGEFIALESTHDEFEIQVSNLAYEPVPTISFIDAVGIRSPAGHEIVFPPSGTRDVIIDGVPEDLPVELDDGTVVDRRGVALDDGTRVHINQRPFIGVADRLYDVVASVAEPRWGNVRGMLGDADGDVTNDGAGPDGEVILAPGDLADPEAIDELLYEEFAPAWLVADDDRMFTGPRREYKPPSEQPPTEFPEQDIADATATCTDLGYIGEPFLAWCTFDILVTGLAPLAETARLLTGANGLTAGVRVVADAGNTPVVTPAVPDVDAEEAQQIASGNGHTCVITAAGGVKCWGNNGSGQLGNNDTAHQAGPVDVVGLGSGVATIAGGDAYTCALTAAGGVKCWGSNTFGQLGDGTTDQRLTPVDVEGLTSGVVAIAAGSTHTCALTAGGAVRCWGNGSNGRLGDGTTEQRLTPVDVVGLGAGVTAIATGTSHTCALTTTGGAKCWGSNVNGRLGDGTTDQRLTPVDVEGLGAGVQTIAAGQSHTCALSGGGGAVCWGSGQFGRLGTGTPLDQHTPVDVVGLTTGVAAIATRGVHTCAITTGGAAKCWGRGVDGQIGDGGTQDRFNPTDVTGLGSGVEAIAPGLQHTCALLEGGRVQCWGRNIEGGLGNGVTTNWPTPVDVLGFGPPTVPVETIASGSTHTCAITAAAGVKCWGNNANGRLGDGTTATRGAPVDVVGLGDEVVGIAAGVAHTCALTTTGGVKCWGSNSQGQLGTDTLAVGASSPTPVDVVGLDEGVDAITAGEQHTCALMLNGTMRCWGSNGSGRLGDGSTTNHPTPVDVFNLAGTVTSIAAGGLHTCALLAGGAVQCWGNNSNGQLGDGGISSQVIPFDVLGLTEGVISISAGPRNTCAVLEDGAVKCWGMNTAGQVGDGTTTQRNEPVDVVGLDDDVVAVTIGELHSCALTEAGSVQCWGTNTNGRLGDGTNEVRTGPVDVVGLSGGVAAIAAGLEHTCALLATGGVKCWGTNTNGRLGDHTLTHRLAPVDVVGFGPLEE